MQISVIIATHNRRQILARSLPKLFNQDIGTDNYEILVIVDGSTDGTIQYLRGLKTQCNLRVLEQSHHGQASAINVGLHNARGDVVLFLDDDIMCPPNLLRIHLRAHSDSTAMLAYGPVLVDPESPQGVERDWASSFCDDFFANLEPEMTHFRVDVLHG